MSFLHSPRYNKLPLDIYPKIWYNDPKPSPERSRI